MNKTKPTLLIPVEIQAREFEAKLLLACVAARRGFPSFIGPRREMHFYISSFPGSIYLSKSTTNASYNVFLRLKKLGCQIVVWDEEALIALPPEFYYRHRLSSQAMEHVVHLFAWGEQNAQLWRQYPHLPKNALIHITGNPRGDLLRPELRGYYQKEVDAIRREYGDFILINTNFNLINAYYPEMNMLMPNPNPAEGPLLTRRAKSMGLSREYALEFNAYKQGILEDFQRLIPHLVKALPDYSIIVRPHPAENPKIYNDLAEKCNGVHVVNKGNVVPWLLAAKVLLHNGCTTGVEAYALGVPAVAYRARVNEQFDHDFHDLSNQLSHQCFKFEELIETLKKIISGHLGVADGGGRKALMDYNLASQTGPLACERILDVLEKMVENRSEIRNPGLFDRINIRIWAAKRRWHKHKRGKLPNMGHNRPEFLRYRYPGISQDEISDRIARFQKLLGYNDTINVQHIREQFFRISA
jgi:surface carbohydrate biosynthesis protein